MSEGSDKYRVVVVVDSREPRSLQETALLHDDVDKWTDAELDAADIVVNGIGFERKTPSDFASSMMEDRLDLQTQKLNDGYDQARILLEGSFEDFDDLAHTSLNPQSARGKAASIDMRHGIPVIPTGGRPGTDAAHELLVDYAIRLGRKATEEPVSGFVKESAVADTEPLGVRLWGCYDGVGPTRAKTLFESLGSPAGKPPNMDELTSIDGIAEKTAHSLREQFDDE